MINDDFLDIFSSNNNNGDILNINLAETTVDLLERKKENLLNKLTDIFSSLSIDSIFNIADFILADYVYKQLENLAELQQSKKDWRN